MSEDGVKKVWLTEWSQSRDGSGASKPHTASITMNAIEMTVTFGVNVGIGGLQLRISPMPMDELGLLRDALNKFWDERMKP